MQCVGIDDITTNTDAQVTVKVEPIDVKEEVTSVPKKCLNVEFFADSIKCEMTFEESCSDQENNAEEIISNTHIGQSKPVGSSFSIKKEEVITDVEKLVEIEPSYERSTRSRLRIKKDYSDKSKDVGKCSGKIRVEKTKEDDTETTFSCNNCTKIFNMKSKLLSHIRSSHSQVKEKQCYPTKKNTEKTNIIEEKRNHNQKNKFDCHVCDKHLCSNSKLICHIRTHTGEKPFACNVCDKKFNQKSNLVSHVRTHTGEKPYACNVCPKQFIIKSNLAVHMRTHTGEKPFACKVCNKQFNQRSNIFNHMKTHSGEKPYACNACPKQFSRKSSLVRHKQSSHR